MPLRVRVCRVASPPPPNGRRVLAPRAGRFIRIVAVLSSAVALSLSAAVPASETNWSMRQLHRPGQPRWLGSRPVLLQSERRGRRRERRPACLLDRRRRTRARELGRLRRAVVRLSLRARRRCGRHRICLLGRRPVDRTCEGSTATGRAAVHHGISWRAALRSTPRTSSGATPTPGDRSRESRRHRHQPELHPAAAAPCGIAVNATHIFWG